MPNLDGAYNITFSPDGTSAYVATGDDLLQFSRTPADGTLTLQGCYGPGAGCSPVPFLDHGASVTVSPDGRNAYMHSTDRLLVFDRNPATGSLVIKPGADGCFSETAVAGCTDAVGLGGAGEVSLSADGKFLYYPITYGIGYFARAVDGTLSQSKGPEGGCITTDGSSSGVAGACATFAGAAALYGGRSASVSPSGKHVLLSSSVGTVVFARAADTGKLTKTDCVVWPDPIVGCQLHPASEGYQGAISPDGTRAVLGSTYVRGVGVYAFDEASGHLTPLASPLGCFGQIGECTHTSHGNLKTSAAPIWAPDGLNFYFAAWGPLYNVAVDAPPVCQPVSTTVSNHSPTAIQMSCSDPNSDSVTVAVRAPGEGHLGRVHQDTLTVNYRPDAGYTGPDSFTYTATAKGVTSAPATVSLKVRSALTIGTRTLRLNAKHRAKVKLTCPAIDESGPCTGKLRIKTRDKVRFDDRHRVVTLATRTFSLAAGTTRSIRVVFSDRMVQLLERNADARKVKLVAKVKDAMGNKATIRKTAKIGLP